MEGGNMIYQCANGIISINFCVDTKLSLNKGLLETYINPFFKIVDNNENKNIDFSIKPFEECKVHKENFARRISYVKLHLGRDAMEEWDNLNGIYFAVYSNIPIAFYLSKHDIVLYCDIKTEIDYYDLMRFIMAICEIKLLKLGYCRCHMTMAKINDCCVAIIGEKCKGKTTFLCNILNDVKHSTHLIANDKCYLKVEDGKILSIGSFEYMGIRKLTCIQFKGLNGKCAFESNEMYFFGLIVY